MPISGQRTDLSMIENMLVHTNPFHVPDEVSAPRFDRSSRLRASRTDRRVCSLSRAAAR